MNDFPELENELRALRPARPSPVLFERIEEAMVENCRTSAAADAGWLAKWFRRFAEWSRGDASDIDGQLVRARERGRASQTPYRFGIGLAAAAAAVVLLLARINTNQTRNEDKEIAQVAPASETRPVVPALSGGRDVDRSMSSNKFIPAGATQVVYNTRNEGLQFADGSREPLRRLRYQTQQTWQWRNPSTGASLRVSYPSEEVVLIPVSGQ
ncbi:MAG: hypothetical protein AUG52_10560 [Verrucomicrobia bacterium 13_1_20CM_3_54_17]|jgi:hypothetical protein|nr:MAG: hypothetical protein AUG52_10560 [Verrucomicrobia bacterium 13_1_20CM_3_54_17]